MTTPSVTLKAFIVGPIGDRDSPDGSPSRIAYEEGVQVLEEVIVPACSAFGVQAIRADDIDRTGEIPEQVFRHLRDAPIVIADLTGANPNVMYELGLRHTTGKLTIQIGERDRLPFDISAIRTIMFKRTPAGLVEGRRRLSQLLAAGLDSGGDPVTATRVWFEAPGAIATLSEKPESSQSDAEEPGFLEKLADTEESFQSLVQAMAMASSINEDITRVISDGTEKIKELDAKGGSSAAKLALVNRIAVLLEEPASRLQVAAGEYGQGVERLEPGLKYLLEQLISDPEQLSDKTQFLEPMRGLIAAAQGSIDSALGFKLIVEHTGSATRSMKRVATRLALSLQAIASASSRIVALKQLTDRLP
jgi:hypothetical protein